MCFSLSSAKKDWCEPGSGGKQDANDGENEGKKRGQLHQIFLNNNPDLLFLFICDFVNIFRMAPSFHSMQLNMWNYVESLKAIVERIFTFFAT